jgi:hypothetical protein
MFDYISIGPTPAEEDCAQVGEEDYYTRARKECNRYIELLLRTFGAEPDGARLRMMRCPHDFGDYLDVVVEYDPAKPESLEYALLLEEKAPSRWDE